MQIGQDERNQSFHQSAGESFGKSKKRKMLDWQACLRICSRVTLESQSQSQSQNQSRGVRHVALLKVEVYELVQGETWRVLVEVEGSGRHHVARLRASLDPAPAQARQPKLLWKSKRSGKRGEKLLKSKSGGGSRRSQSTVTVQMFSFDV
jgi:hypothetical protein